MYLTGAQGQRARHFSFDASGTIATGGTPQLVLADSRSRSLFYFQNISDTNMLLKFGAGTATATLTNGVVTSISVVDGGFGFTYPPHVEFLGGGFMKQNGTVPNPTSVGGAQPGFDAPDNVAQAIAVLTGGSVTSFQISNGGSGYSVPPLVHLYNSLRDPVGAADPSLSSGTGFLMVANGGNITLDKSAVPTGPVAVYCATTGKKFTCMYMP